MNTNNSNKKSKISYESKNKEELSLRSAEILREAIVSAENSSKSFSNGLDLINDALKDS